MSYWSPPPPNFGNLIPPSPVPLVRPITVPVPPPNHENHGDRNKPPEPRDSNTGR